MDEQNNNQNPENDKNNYIHNLDDSTLSNPFSNALKSINQFLEKINLKKPEQARIGTKETNSRGFQTTSKDVLEATEKKSLKAILRNAFEARQQKRAEKLRAKTATNTMPKYTVGEQGKSTEQTQTVSKDPTKEFIRPLTAAEKAAMKAQAVQQAPNLINNTVILAQTEDKIEEKFDSPTSGEINVDESYTQDTDNKSTETQEVVQAPLRAENLNVENNSTKIVIPKTQKTTKPTENKNTQEHGEIDI